MYSLIRHPAYMGEIIMSVACVLANPKFYMLLLFLAIVVFQIMRVYEEEKILFRSGSYAQYSRKVKWRFIPFVW
jgi:protein-S-isoprenylcysteine O-methyltransferase Ste14